MKIGFIGLGKMGLPMVTRLLRGGHEVIVRDHHQENIAAAVSQGAVAAEDDHQVIGSGDSPAVVWLMIPADAVETQIRALLGDLKNGDIIVDGGNSDYRQTREHAKLCAERGVRLVDVGTSGGVLGLEHGYSIMAGGDEDAYRVVEPLLAALARPEGYGYFGASGAGHYTKMVHNAIEYGVMQSYAEGYRLLHDSEDYPSLPLERLAAVWQRGSIIESSLNEVMRKVLAADPELQEAEGYVAESGEAKWTLETAESQQIPMPAIRAAYDARIATHSGDINFGTKLLAATRHGFGGHVVNHE